MQGGGELTPGPGLGLKCESRLSLPRGCALQGAVTMAKGPQRIIGTWVPQPSGSCAPA